MTITFKQARAAVDGETLPRGYEDDQDYNVLMADPEIDDLVTLVTKEDGKVHQEVYFEIEDRLDQMTPVTDA